MVLVHKNLSRLSVSGSIFQLTASRAAVILQQISQDNGFIWVFGMGEPGYENEVAMSQNQIQAVLLLENLPHRFLSLFPPGQWKTQNKTKKKKEEKDEQCNSEDKSKEEEEKKTALSSIVINTLLSLMFRSHVNFALGNAVMPIGLLRNSSEDTVGMDGDESEESWRDLGT